MALAMALIGPVMQLFAYGLNWYLSRQVMNQETAKNYLAFLEIMERSGLASVKMRLDAHDQVERVKKMWEDDHDERK